MAVFKHEEERQTLREAGRRLARILDVLLEKVVVGVTTKELDEYAYQAIAQGGDVPAFLNYTPEGAGHPFPATVCISINEEVVHGIPSTRKIKEGDIVTLDIGLIHGGAVVDMARTIIVGGGTEKERELLSLTKKSLDAGIAVSRVGAHVGDIGEAIENVIKGSSFKVVYELGGHGVGRRVHEDPFVANVGKKGEGPVLHDGEVLALEPIVSMGSPEILQEEDGYTIATKDGSRSAHFEDTILITKDGTEIVTRV